jgi:hypothetical protein
MAVDLARLDTAWPHAAVVAGWSGTRIPASRQALWLRWGL